MTNQIHSFIYYDMLTYIKESVYFKYPGIL